MPFPLPLVSGFNWACLCTNPSFSIFASNAHEPNATRDPLGESTTLMTLPE